MPVMVFIFYSGIVLLGIDLAGLHSGCLYKIVDLAVRLGLVSKDLRNGYVA
ncbi:MAG: hypothetical protein HGB14_08700 [Anaerolineaceae bacterium]|nr:hypothetical protein [Anaerolineaceae bacterium]